MKRVLTFRRRRRESGISLVELLITISIMGVVGSGIAAMFVLAMDIEPTARGRTTFSSDSAFLIRQISNDVAGADTVTPESATLTCTAATGLEVATITLVNGTEIKYRADVTSTTSAEVLRVEITRQQGSGPAVPMLGAYCPEGDPFAWITYDEPNYSLRLSLMVSPDGEARELSMGGAKRTIPASFIAISGYVRMTTSTGTTGLDNWQVTVWPEGSTTPIELSTASNGYFSTILSPGTYKVCQQKLTVGWQQTSPTGTSGGLAASGCPSTATNPTQSIGYEITEDSDEDLLDELDFLNGYVGGGSGFNCNDTALTNSIFDPDDPWWPTFKGPDYVVRTALGESIQDALDASKKPDGPAQGDINHDGMIMIGVLSGAGGGTGGKATVNQTVTIDGDYAFNGKKFALVGCAGGVTSTSGPAIRIHQEATALETIVPDVNGTPANIMVFNMYGTESTTGVRVEGDGRLLRSVKAQNNVAGGGKPGNGIEIIGDNNIVYDGDTNENAGHGIAITGNDNVVIQGTRVTKNGLDGINVNGHDNEFIDVESGASGSTGNGGDGIDVTGNNNSFNDVQSRANGGAGFRIVGNGTSFVNTQAGANSAGNGANGYDITGSNTFIDQSTAFENTGIGVRVSGNSNTIEDTTANGDNSATTTNGFDVTGNSNTLRRLEALKLQRVGFRIAGDNNTIESSTAEENSDGTSFTGSNPKVSHGYEVIGNSNTLRNVEAIENRGIGISVTGNSNTLISTGNMINVTGSALDGIYVAGHSNTIDRMTSEDNYGDGFDISGGTSSAQANVIRNSRSNTGNNGSGKDNAGLEFRLSGWITNGGSNRADNTNIPAAGKCPSPQFPSGSSAVNVTPPPANAGQCE